MKNNYIKIIVSVVLMFVPVFASAQAIPVLPFPALAGSAGKILQSTGTTTKWAATSSLGISASPGGSNTQIQFNNSGAFGGSSNLTWDGSTLYTGGNIGIGTTSPSQLLSVGSSGGNSAYFAGGVGVGIAPGGSYNLNVAGGINMSAASTHVALNITDSTKAFQVYTGSTDVEWGTVSNHNLGFFTNNATPMMELTTGGNVGIGTTTPYKTLTVSGDLALTGGLFDSTASAGTSGMVLQTTGTATKWVATSSLGISASSGGSNTQIQFNNSGSFGGSSNLTWDGTTLYTGGNVGIGTTTPTSKLSVSGGYITAVGGITSPGAGSLSEQFGNGAVAGAYSVAIGNNASAATYSVAIGQGAATTLSSGLDRGVAIGYFASSAGSGTSIGFGSNSVDQGIAIGHGSNVTSPGGIAIGINANAGLAAINIGLYGTATGGINIGRAGSSVNGQTTFSPSDGTANTGGVLTMLGTTDGNAYEKNWELTGTWINSTDATRKARVVFNTYDSAATREFLRADATGSGVQVGIGGAINGSNLLTVNGSSYTTATSTSNNVVVSSISSPTYLAADANGKIIATTSPKNIPQIKGTTQARYYGAGYSNGQALTNSVVVANTLYALPIFISAQSTAIAIESDVESAIAASTAELGIYSDSNGLPGALLLDAGSITTASVGTKSITISQSLPPGQYWLVIDYTNAVTVKGYPTNGLLPLVGSPATIAAASTNYAAVTMSQASGALPANFSSTPTYISSPPFPYIAVELQ